MQGVILRMRLRLQKKRAIVCKTIGCIPGFAEDRRIYNADTELKGLSSKERLQKRQEVIKPMVEEFFAWVKQQVSDCTVPPKSKPGQGLNFVINQEKYLRIFPKMAICLSTIQLRRELYEPFVWTRKTGCSTILQKERLPVQWYIVFLKPQS